MEVPDTVLEDFKIQELTRLAIDMIILANVELLSIPYLCTIADPSQRFQDVYSYNVEQSRDDDSHNIVAVAMKDKSFDLQSAMDYVGEQYQILASAFVRQMHDLPKCSCPGDLEQYVWGLGNWVTANVWWSYESERYFGAHGLEVMKHRRVELLPKRQSAGVEDFTVLTTIGKFLRRMVYFMPSVL